jgi:hypothetical protein
VLLHDKAVKVHEYLSADLHRLTQIIIWTAMTPRREYMQAYPQIADLLAMAFIWLDMKG